MTVDVGTQTAPAPKPRKRHRWLRVLLILLLVLVLVIVGFALAVRYWFPGRSFPQTAGSIQVPGLSAPVDVLRDEFGVPQIYADTPSDLFMGQGYVSAQDRFFEMDFRRHITAGRISEMVGSGQLKTDKFLRTMGWRATAQLEYDSLPARYQVVVDAYTAGVNAWISEHGGTSASLEYLVIGALTRGYTIEPWTPADSLAWLKALAYDLRENMDTEALRTVLAKTLSPAQIKQLYPPYPYDRNATIQRAAGVQDPTSGAQAAPLPDGQLVRPASAYVLPAGASEPVQSAGSAATNSSARLGGQSSVGIGSENGTVLDSDALDSMLALLGTHSAEMGSNNWVIGGDLVDTGRSLVANDPHLGPAMPSLWSQVGLHCRTVDDACPYDVAGFALAGVPGIIIGHNAAAAWAVTNTGADTTDLFLEKVEGDTYLVDGKPRPLQTRTEEIRYPGGSQTITVRATEHGPLLSDLPDTDFPAVGQDAAVPAGSPPRGDGYGVALNWTALRPGTSFQALVDIWTAANWADFRKAGARFDALPQNLVFADTQGNIGFQIPGLIPIRSGFDGNSPAPGWDSKVRWTGYIPADRLPSFYNPPNKWVITANQVLVQPGYPYKIGAGYNYGYRAQRILDLVREKTANGSKSLSLADSQAIQSDTQMPFAPFLVPYLLDVKAGADVQQAVDLLRTWDFRQPVDSPEAAYFNAVWLHLLQRTFGDQLTGSTAANSGDRWFEVVRDLMSKPNDPFWDDVSTPETETRDTILVAAMTDAFTELKNRLGEDSARWKWGDIHTLKLVATPLGESGIGPIEGLFNRGPFPVAGGYQSVAVNSYDASKGYEVDHVASMRMTVDVGGWDSSVWVNLTGASGHAYSSHYLDQFPLWQTAQNPPWSFTPDAVDKATQERLTLTP